jgi:hypothetical protein
MLVCAVTLCANRVATDGSTPRFTHTHTHPRQALDFLPYRIEVLQQATLQILLVAISAQLA